MNSIGLHPKKSKAISADLNALYWMLRQKPMMKAWLAEEI